MNFKGHTGVLYEAVGDGEWHYILQNAFALEHWMKQSEAEEQWQWSKNQSQALQWFCYRVDL